MWDKWIKGKWTCYWGGDKKCFFLVQLHCSDPFWKKKRKRGSRSPVSFMSFYITWSIWVTLIVMKFISDFLVTPWTVLKLGRVWLIQRHQRHNKGSTCCKVGKTTQVSHTDSYTVQGTKNYYRSDDQVSVALRFLQQCSPVNDVSWFREDTLRLFRSSYFMIFQEFL